VIARETESSAAAGAARARSPRINSNMAVSSFSCARVPICALVEFSSVVDAVRCAIEVQNGMIERNAGVAASARIVRIDKIEPPAPDRRLRSCHADRSALSPAVELRRCPDFLIEDSEGGR